MATPPAEYNFAVIPVVTDRDEFWEMKQRGETKPKKYQDIAVPKNSGVGVMIGISSFLCGFGLVWHIWWLALVGFIAVIVLLIVRLTSDDTERIITASEVAKFEKAGGAA